LPDYIGVVDPAGFAGTPDGGLELARLDLREDIAGAELLNLDDDAPAGFCLKFSVVETLGDPPVLLVVSLMSPSPSPLPPSIKRASATTNNAMPMITTNTNRVRSFFIGEISFCIWRSNIRLTT
jgi:hypothetical protein